MDIKNTYFSFTDNMNPMKKQKVENTLDKLTRYDGVVYKDKELIYKKLLEGAKPRIEYNYSYYSRKLDDYIKPKDDYRIEWDENGTVFYHISKTLYDYAIYLLENDFIDEQKANAFIVEEQNRIELEKQKQIEQEQKQKEEQQARIQAAEDFKNWHNEQASNYNNTEKLDLAREIFLNEIGQYNDFQLKRLLVLIENIDNPDCKVYLKNWLHSGNTASKKIFTHITGIRLHPTNKRTEAILDTVIAKDFTGMLPYKKRQEKVKNEMTDTFYKMIKIPEPHFEAVRGEYIKKYGLDMFITESEVEGYALTECKSGLLITTAKSKQLLFEKLKKLIEQYSVEKINEMIHRAIERTGLSPKYQIAS